MTNPQLPAYEGQGGWFQLSAERWEVLEGCYGNKIPEPLRSDICAILARYTEEAFLEDKAESISEAEARLNRVRDKTEELLKELMGIPRGGFVDHLLDGHIDLDGLRSLLHRTKLACNDAEAELTKRGETPEALVQPKAAWKRMRDDLAAAFKRHGLSYSVSAKPHEEKASPALRLAIELHNLLPRTCQLSSNVGLAGWRDRFQPSRGKKK
jgi:hypothetical protein